MMIMVLSWITAACELRGGASLHGREIHSMEPGRVKMPIEDGGDREDISYSTIFLPWSVNYCYEEKKEYLFFIFRLSKMHIDTSRVR